MGERVKSRRAIAGCWLIASVMPVAGCGLDVPFPDGVASCADDDECPSGFACLDRGDGLLCYDGDESGSGGSTETGGASMTGGSSSGGSEATGGSSSGGSTESGGSSTTGGTTTGGMATGGTTTGGVATGGTMTGGMTTGGMVTGGMVTGGMVTGGMVTGGTMTTGGTVPGNTPPEVAIKGIPDTGVLPQSVLTIDCEGTDADNDPLTLSVQAPAGTLDGDTPPVQWTVPRKEGTYGVNCRADDGRGGVTNTPATVQVLDTVPVVMSVDPKPALVLWGGTSEITCKASDANVLFPNQLNYSWSDDFGHVKNGNEVTTVYEVPSGAKVGDDTVKCTAADDANQSDTGATRIRVMPSGLTAYFPFNNDLEDFAPMPKAAELEAGGEDWDADRNGNSKSAFKFDGATALVLAGAADIRDTWTFAAWVDLNSKSTATEVLLSRGGGVLSLVGTLTLAVDPTGNSESEGTHQVSISSSSTLGGTTEAKLGSPFTPTGWLHVAVTYDVNRGATLYFNGRSQGSQNVSLNTSSSADFFVGASPTRARFFSGSMDDLQLYTVALGDSAIEQLTTLAD